MHYFLAIDKQHSTFHITYWSDLSSVKCQTKLPLSMCFRGQGMTPISTPSLTNVYSYNSSTPTTLHTHHSTGISSRHIIAGDFCFNHTWLSVLFARDSIRFLVFPSWVIFSTRRICAATKNFSSCFYFIFFW